METLGLIRSISTVGVIFIALAATVRGEDAPQQQAEPAPAETPLGRFFDRLFEGVNDPPPTDPSTDDESLPVIEGTPRITPDAIDERAAAGRQQQRDLIRAQRLLQTGDYSIALPLLQQLLDAPEDTLILTADGQWESLQRTVERAIGSSGENVHRAYVERFRALADERLRMAKVSGYPEDYAIVAQRFLFTPAGQEAAHILLTLSRDAGEPAEVAYWNTRVLQDGGPTHLTLPEGDAAATLAGANGLDHAATDWPQPFGGPKHHATLPPIEPVLIERWAAPLAVRASVATQVDWLVRDLVDNHQACVPTALPLAVDGKIISRTLRGVSVLDAASGRLLWESAEGASVERLLLGDDIPRPGGEPTGHGMRSIPAYQGTNADGHPLANLLFRDGVYGLVSSDREQVFVLEDHATLSYRQPGYFWGRRVDDDPFHRDWGTNRLVAYDLETGAVRWRIGGQRLDEPFDPPLAGTLFLGPPVVDHEELFLIGERDGTMFLFVLDRLSGEPKWEHAISEVGAAIEQDLVRRWWPAQPAVGRGVIVCPTTAGWMVAIDRLQRRIRWTYRYIETRQKKVSSNRSRIAATGPLNARWCPSAPVMTSQHVVFTPPELPDPLYGDQPVVVCLDLLTGQRVWRDDKGTQLYLGGVIGERILLVGKESVEARELKSGKRLWETRLDRPPPGVDGNTTAGRLTWHGALGQPSGRGIIVGDSYLLPLQSGQLAAFDIETGTIHHRYALRADDRPLGNLLVYRGRLVSVGPFAIRCFEDRATITAELADTAPAATSAASRLRAAELQFMEGDFAAARTTLQQLEAAALSASQQEQANELRWDTLLRLVHADLTAANAEFAELGDLAVTDEQQLTVERARADRLLARGDRAAAFDVYWQHAQHPQSVMVTEGDTSLRFDRWLAGRLQRLWSAATPEQRRGFDEHIAAAAQAAASADDDALAWWSEVLRFHPSGDGLRRALAEAAVEHGRWTSAEIHLLQLVEESNDPQIQRGAFSRLLALLLERDRPHDALAYADTYEPLIDGGEAIRQSYADRLPSESRPPVTSWSDGTWTLSRSPATFNRAMFEPVLAIEPGLPSVDQLQLRVEPTLDRLSIETLGGDTVWATPLQAQAQSFYHQTTGVASVGQLLFVVHRGVLHGLSVADRELLWRQKFDLRSASSGYVRGPSNVPQQELRESRSFLWSEGLRQTSTPMGMLAVWRPGYVVYFGQHTLTVADPLTGETLWQRHDVPPRTMAYGTSDTVYLVPPSPDDPLVLSVLDGSPVELPRLKSLMDSAVDVNDGGLVLIEQRQPFRLFSWGLQSVRLRLVDPQTGDTAWAADLPNETRIARLDHHEFIAAHPDGSIETINGRTGQRRTLGSVGPEAMQDVQRIFAAAERGRVYIAFNHPPTPGSYSRSYQSMPVHGTLAAFDRQGGLLWQQVIEDQNLIVDQLADLSVLILTSQRRQRDGDVTSQQVFVEVRDKETGEPLLEDSRYITGGNLREMSVDHVRQLIDLKTYNERLRLSVSDE